MEVPVGKLLERALGTATVAANGSVVLKPAGCCFKVITRLCKVPKNQASNTCDKTVMVSIANELRIDL